MVLRHAANDGPEIEIVVLPIDWDNVRVGDRFVDASNADPEWRPGPGEKYADAPLAINQVTMRRGEMVWYHTVSRSTGLLHPGKARARVEWLRGRSEGTIP